MPQQLPRCSTGIAGLEIILEGGLPSNCAYLIKGSPGSGKTTLALQFLLAGAKQGEQGLYITLSESRAELEAVAGTHGWDLSPLALLDLTMVEDLFTPEEQTTLFQPAEVDLQRVMERIFGEIARTKPKRFVFDSLTELQLLCQDRLRFRRQILALKQRLAQDSVTVLLLDDLTLSRDEQLVESIVHGVISLERTDASYGSMRRRMTVEKMRGVGYRTGYNDYLIETGGIRIFPRLIASEHHAITDTSLITSGLRELDHMLGGGIKRGSSLLIIGPAGSGKSSIASSFLNAAGRANEPTVVWSFEETYGIFSERALGLGFDLQPFIDQGTITVRQSDPGNISPGELSQRMREDVKSGVRLVVIDSMSGYLNSMPEEKHLQLHLHEMLTYLNQQGVVTIIAMAQHGMMRPEESTDISYIADSVLLLRFFEAFGQVKKAVSVIKKRTGGHENTIREFSMAGGKLRVGEALTNFQGVLSGTPTFAGKREDILKSELSAQSTDG